MAGLAAFPASTLLLSGVLEVDDAELALVSDPGGCTSDPEEMDPASTGSGGGGGAVDGALGGGGGSFGGGAGGTTLSFAPLSTKGSSGSVAGTLKPSARVGVGGGRPSPKVWSTPPAGASWSSIFLRMVPGERRFPFLSFSSCSVRSATLQSSSGLDGVSLSSTYFCAAFATWLFLLVKGDIL